MVSGLVTGNFGRKKTQGNKQGKPLPIFLFHFSCYLYSAKILILFVHYCVRFIFFQPHQIPEQSGVSILRVLGILPFSFILVDCFSTELKILIIWKEEI